jgi:hypothetical protein
LPAVRDLVIDMKIEVETLVRSVRNKQVVDFDVYYTKVLEINPPTDKEQLKKNQGCFQTYGRYPVCLRR